MTVYFDGVGFEAEQLCVNQFRGKLLTSKEYQYKDIDCFVKSKQGVKYTASVKDQRSSTKQGYNTIQLELEQVNTRNNKTCNGCFVKNQSDYYFWLVVHNNKEQWCIVKSSVLKEYVKKNKHKLPTWQTKPNTEAKNRKYGRTYDRSKGVLVTIEKLLELGEMKELAHNEV